MPPLSIHQGAALTVSRDLYRPPQPQPFGKRISSFRLEVSSTATTCSTLWLQRPPYITRTMMKWPREAEEEQQSRIKMSSTLMQFFFSGPFKVCVQTNRGASFTGVVVSDDWTACGTIWSAVKLWRSSRPFQIKIIMSRTNYFPIENGKCDCLGGVVAHLILRDAIVPYHWLTASGATPTTTIHLVAGEESL